MTTATRPQPAPAATRLPTFRDVLRSEWIKLISLPGNSLAVAGIFAVGLGGTLFLGVTLESSGAPSVPSIERTMSEITTTLVLLGQIVAGILGVMAAGSE